MTSVPALLGCRRRYELGQRPRSRARGHFNVPAVLGDLCHESLRRLTEARDILSEDWEEGLQRAWEEAQDQLLDGMSGEVDPSLWPGSKVARARMRNAAQRLREILMPFGKEIELICEERMSALDRRLIGKPDLVIASDGGHWIVDYKTGHVLDSETEQPLDEYVIQLCLYAVLEHSRAGKWPIRGVLLPFAQRTVEIDFDQGACQRLASDVADAIETYNEEAPGTQPASPTPANCQWCRHATECDAVWASCDESWQPRVSLARGSVVQAVRSAIGVVTVVVDVSDGTLGSTRIAIKADPRLHPKLEWLEPGQEVMASGLWRRRGERTFSASPWAELRIGGA